MSHFRAINQLQPEQPLPGTVEGGKPTEVEKQMTIKACLNRITPDNFQQVLAGIIAVGYETVDTETCLVNQIYNKALTDTTLSGICADLCFRLETALPSFEPPANYGNRCPPSTFRKLLLNKCQEEFVVAPAAMEAVEAHDKAEQDVTEARQRALGNVQFLGDFFHRRMLKEKVIRDCIKELLGDVAAPKQGHLECMVKLMNIVGQQLDANPRAIIYMNAYFEHITMLGKNMSLDGRIRLMLQNLVELRRHSWVARKQDSHSLEPQEG